MSHLDVPVVVTPDHGEHLGDHLEDVTQYTHPDYTHPVLWEVPWFVVSEESKGRNDLSDPELRTDRGPGKPLDKLREGGGNGDEDKDGSGLSDEVVADRLEAFGYR